MDKELEPIAEFIVGKHFDQARKFIIENTEYVSRVTKKGDKFYWLTADLRFDRINMELDEQEIVTSIKLG